MVTHHLCVTAFDAIGAHGLRVPSARDVYVHGEVDLVQVVGRDGPSPIPEQLRERYVIALPHQPVSLIQIFVVPVIGW